jgi:hypothetical protein
MIGSKNVSRYPGSEFLLDLWAECAGPLSLLAVLVPAFFLSIAWENRALARQAPTSPPSAEQRLQRLEERVTQLESQLKAALDKPGSPPTAEQVATIAAEERKKANDRWWYIAAGLAFLGAGTFFVSWGVNKWKRRNRDRNTLKVRLSKLE